MLRTLVVAKSPVHGSGVFTMVDILAGMVFHTEEVTVFNRGSVPPKFKNYVYPWIGEYNLVSVPNHTAKFFNHSNTPNARIWSIDTDKKTMSFSALRNITAGEEVFISYTADCTTPNWFR